MAEDVKSRIESEAEVRAYIQNLKYALENGARRNVNDSNSIREKIVFLLYE